MPTTSFMGFPELAPEMRRVAARRFLTALCEAFGGEVNAARAHQEFHRIIAKYRPQVPGDAGAGPRELLAIDSWDRAYRLAKATAFARWPNLNQGASVEVRFMPTFRVRVRRELLGGYGGDDARLNILCREYVVEHDQAPEMDRNHLIFRDADDRGGDLTVDLAEYVGLAAFPDELA